MNFEEFDKLVDGRLHACKKLMESKNREYARDGNKLHNFKSASLAGDLSLARACFGMYLKHFISIKDMITDVENGRQIPKSLMDEKMNDSINYHMLMEACMVDMMKENYADKTTIGHPGGVTIVESLDDIDIEHKDRKFSVAAE